MRRRMRERSAAGVRDQSANAFSAAATASSTSRLSLSGDLRIRLARRRLDVVEIFAADRLNELAVDEVSDLEWFSGHGRSLNKGCRGACAKRLTKKTGARRGERLYTEGNSEQASTLLHS